MKMLAILEDDIDGTSSIVPSGFTQGGNLSVVSHEESFSMWAAGWKSTKITNISKKNTLTSQIDDTA